MELKDSKHPQPQSDEDLVTVELRNEFTLLNRILALREIAKVDTKKKLNRKAARAAIKQSKKSSKKAAPQNTITAVRLFSAPAKIQAGEWVKKICWRCRNKFSIHTGWDKPPSLCRPCAKDIDETYLPSGPDHSTPFSKVHFVSGGAPGSGKRR